MTKDVKRLSDFYQKILQTTSDCDDKMHQDIHTQGVFLAILKYDDANGVNPNKNMAFTVDNVNTEAFVGAADETDESLNGKVAARAEKIEVDKDIDIDERKGSGVMSNEFYCLLGHKGIIQKNVVK